MKTKETDATNNRTVRKVCGNCRYFSQHYGKVDLNIAPVNCGHCKKRRMDNYANKFPDSFACKKWEPEDIRIQEEKVKIEKRLLNMYEQIIEIYEYIKN